MALNTSNTMRISALLNNMFAAAVDAALPANNIAGHLPHRPSGKTIVIGAGKASAAMAQAVEQQWPDGLHGLVIAPHGKHPACKQIEIVEASHPVPDEAGEMAARRMIEMVSELQETDLVLSLISGGGSSLLSLPGKGITLSDKQLVNNALLKSGAAIDEMNCVRKCLSAIKGGRLAAAAYPAKVVTLAISDVPGDDPSIIASGPTAQNFSTREQAQAIIDRYKIDLPDNVKALLESEDAKTPLASDVRMSTVETHVVCKPQQSLEAAAAIAESAGLNVIILGDAIEGEAREVGKVMAGIAKQVAKHDQPVKKPAVLISGGETTVTVRAKGGRGGRNAEYLLGFAEACIGWNNIHAIAADTDGIDGTESNAGVIWTPVVASKAQKLNLKLSSFLDNNNAWSFFDAADGIVTTGPTHTNVNDFRAIVIV